MFAATTCTARYIVLVWDHVKKTDYARNCIASIILIANVKLWSRLSGRIIPALPILGLGLRAKATALWSRLSGRIIPALPILGLGLRAKATALPYGVDYPAG